MEKAGRTRAPNFSPYEVERLIDLAEKYKTIIENKKTDNVSVKEKDITWRKISEEFNSVFGVTQRTHTNLKTVYENLKRKVRRDVANDNLDTYRTSGGTGGPKKLDSIWERILGIISPSVQVQSSYDSDAGYGEPSTAQERSSPVSAPLPMQRTLSPVQVLEDIVNGESAGSECEDTDSRSSQPLKRKSDSLENLEDAQKTKVPAADLISHAAETSRALQSELQMKEEEHSMRMKIGTKELELLQIKKQISLEKLKFWKSRNVNS